MVGKLKPCPCCGDPLPGMVRDRHNAYVACSTFGCWLSGPVAETEEGAARKWNALAGAAEEVERLRKEYANPERILRLLSTRILSTMRGGEEDKPLRMACYLLALACQRMHCAGCFLTHHKEWCPKSCNEGRAVVEGVSQEEWYSFLREKEGEEDESL